MCPQQPFFLYFATGGIHAPVQVPADYAARYRGKFDQGWDRLREETFARRKRLGVIPANTQLTPRPDGLPAWNSLTPDQKKVSTRLIESYAGFLAHTDEQVGRMVQALKNKGEFDHALFIYIVGDNGTSAEGGIEGSLNYMGPLQGIPEPLARKACPHRQDRHRRKLCAYQFGLGAEHQCAVPMDQSRGLPPWRDT